MFSSQEDITYTHGYTLATKQFSDLSVTPCSEQNRCLTVPAKLGGALGGWYARRTFLIAL